MPAAVLQRDWDLGPTMDAKFQPEERYLFRQSARNELPPKLPPAFSAL
jgi:hypothetical protein